MKKKEPLNEAQKIFQEIRRKESERALKMPEEKDAIMQIFEGVKRLEDLGWGNSIYAPKDRTFFKAIEAGSCGIARTNRDDKGRFWAYEAGDIWPSKPILFKLEESTMDSTDDSRIDNNVMRHEYRVLTEEEKATMKEIKDIGLAFVGAISMIGDSRELSLAKTKMEEAVMWAVKHITK
jgi:hypothetical protein